MAHILFTLHGNDGHDEYQEIEDAPVPRVNELITFDSQRCYQVIDVLWHFGASTHVSITACELNWHVHIAKAHAVWNSTSHG